jgi:3-isopropylmalate/(R)-2-methylmalate dehydratase small subunit
MQPFTTLTAVACPLGLANVDTDQLIPARFMSRPRSTGYGQFLLHDVRANRAALLMDARYAGAGILVTRQNFGVGSSREAAVYALWDYGIRCVVAPSFGDIFASNATKNGLLTATVSDAEAERLLEQLAAAPSPTLTVDLDRMVVTGSKIRDVTFTIDPVGRLQLLNGWDDIDLTLRHKSEIKAFKDKRLASQSWIRPTSQS